MADPAMCLDKSSHGLRTITEQSRQSITEDFLLTSGIGTTKATESDSQNNVPSLPGKICHLAAIMTMDAFRRLVTTGTAGSSLNRLNGNHYCLCSNGNILDLQAKLFGKYPRNRLSGCDMVKHPASSECVKKMGKLSNAFSSPSLRENLFSTGVYNKSKITVA